MQSPPTLFKVLADPVRFAIVESLAKDGESCACELLERFTISQPTLSHHMKVLCGAGLVSSRKLGTWMHYNLERDAFESLIGALVPLSRGEPRDSDSPAAGSSPKGACGPACAAKAGASV